jgi:hypothetical protein
VSPHKDHVWLVIPKKSKVIMPCVSFTTKRFWEEQHLILKVEEWESRYFPEELVAIAQVLHSLGLSEITEGIFEFAASTPEGKVRQEKAIILYEEEKWNDLRVLQEEIVEQDLKPALENLGAVEVPQISEHLRKGYFSQ